MFVLRQEPIGQVEEVPLSKESSVAAAPQQVPCCLPQPPVASPAGVRSPSGPQGLELGVPQAQATVSNGGFPHADEPLAHDANAAEQASLVSAPDGLLPHAQVDPTSPCVGVCCCHMPRSANPEWLPQQPLRCQALPESALLANASGSVTINVTGNVIVNFTTPEHPEEQMQQVTTQMLAAVVVMVPLPPLVSRHSPVFLFTLRCRRTFLATPMLLPSERPRSPSPFAIWCRITPLRCRMATGQTLASWRLPWKCPMTALEARCGDAGAIITLCCCQSLLSVGCAAGSS